jgi:hypothetical protein
MVNPIKPYQYPCWDINITSVCSASKSGPFSLEVKHSPQASFLLPIAVVSRLDGRTFDVGELSACYYIYGPTASPSIAGTRPTIRNRCSLRSFFTRSDLKSKKMELLSISIQRRRRRRRHRTRELRS